MTALILFIIANKAAFFAAGWGVCEILAHIPRFKANSLFQLIYTGFAKTQPKPPEV